MAAPTAPLATTASVLESTHPLPVYDGDRGNYRHTKPASISETAEGMRIPTKVVWIDPTTLVNEGKKYAARRRVTETVDEEKIVEGSSTLERRTEQCSVTCLDAHVVRPVMEIFSAGFGVRDKKWKVQHTWEYQLNLPDIPKAQEPKTSGKSADRQASSKKRRLSQTRESSANVSSTEHEPKYVTVRPDLIVVRTAKSERLNLGKGRPGAASRCISVLEMKREGVISSRVENMMKVATERRDTLHSNPRRNRGTITNPLEREAFDLGSTNLLKQLIQYNLACRVPSGAASDYDSMVFVNFPDMKTGAEVGIKELWDIGVGETMEISVLGPERSADIRAAWFGFLALGSKALSESTD
ncbi:hypothetical protein CSHISOI_05605 [Colletotrichum shisoi]|uniref:Uncharacterized protein n=1 Tax=Colletotrichum shisoi TaxID=2078593 RepID=A0A5Q4BS44_9PEZI|nr:hypothetical protein CSHISOI_05605 [Colletotrichum shisoi]